MFLIKFLLLHVVRSKPVEYNFLSFFSKLKKRKCNQFDVCSVLVCKKGEGDGNERRAGRKTVFHFAKIKRKMNFQVMRITLMLVVGKLSFFEIKLNILKVIRLNFHSSPPPDTPFNP